MGKDSWNKIAAVINHHWIILVQAYVFELSDATTNYSYSLKHDLRDQTRLNNIFPTLTFNVRSYSRAILMQT